MIAIPETKYLKSILNIYGFSQEDWAKEWSRLSSTGPKFQSSLNRMLNKNERFNNLEALIALARLCKISIMDILECKQPESIKELGKEEVDKNPLKENFESLYDDLKRIEGRFYETLKELK